MTHRIVAVCLFDRPGCERCSPASPHQVVVRCSCGQTAAGREDHTWTAAISADETTVSLKPSFNWLNDPADPSAGSHLHEFARGVALVTTVAELVQ